MVSARTIDPSRLEPSLQSKYDILTYFISFFEIKYKPQLLKRMADKSSPVPVYIRKRICLDNEILLRLSNGCVQLCFNDLSCLMMNRNDDKCLYYVDRHG